MGCLSCFAVLYWIPKRCPLEWNWKTGLVQMNCKPKFIKTCKPRSWATGPSAKATVDTQCLCLTRVPGRSRLWVRGYPYGVSSCFTGRFFCYITYLRSTLWRKIFTDVIGLLQQEWINSAGKKHNAISMFSGLHWNNQTCAHVSPA